MLVKYVALLTLTAMAAADPSPAVVAPQQAAATAADAATDGLTWTEVIQCYSKPQAAIGCLETRMSRALRSMRDTAVRMARSDPNTAAEDAAGVGDLVQQIGEFISYGISSYFRGDAASETDDEPAAAGAGSPAGVPSSPTDVDEGERFSHVFSPYPPPSHTPYPTNLCDSCAPVWRRVDRDARILFTRPKNTVRPKGTCRFRPIAVRLT